MGVGFGVGAGADHGCVGLDVGVDAGGALHLALDLADLLAGDGAGHGAIHAAASPVVRRPVELLGAGGDGREALAEEGVGIAVLPDYLVAAALTARRLVVLPPDGGSRRARPARNTLFVGWRGAAITTARLRATLEALQAPGG